jgi:hypothetical protein
LQDFQKNRKKQAIQDFKKRQGKKIEGKQILMIEADPIKGIEYNQSSQTNNDLESFSAYRQKTEDIPIKKNQTNYYF